MPKQRLSPGEVPHSNPTTFSSASNSYLLREGGGGYQSRDPETSFSMNQLSAKKLYGDTGKKPTTLKKTSSIGKGIIGTTSSAKSSKTLKYPESVLSSTGKSSTLKKTGSPKYTNLSNTKIKKN